MKTAMSASMVAFGVALSASTGLAEELNVVCSNEQAWCDLMAQNFEIETGIDVAIVRKSTGEVLAQLRAEKGNPKVDVWWGGTGDPHIIAANEGLTTASGVDLSGTVGWAQNMAEMTKGRTVGVHVGLLGMIYGASCREGPNSTRLLARSCQARIQGRNPGCQPQFFGNRLYRVGDIGSAFRRRGRLSAACGYRP